MISLENISIGFQEKVLFDNLNWRIPRGSRIGLVGNNGTGKTTLFRTIVGLVNPIKVTLLYHEISGLATFLRI